MQNSPRVKLAQDDLHRATALLSESRDLYIPSVSAGGGVGYSYGITLNVPTIFTLNTQSLVYSPAQRDYIRAARTGVQAALLACAGAREVVEEDAAITYLSFAQAQTRAAVLTEATGFAARLVFIVQDRLNGGLETQLDLKRARRTAAQLKLEQLQAEDEVATLREHLAQLLGLPADQLTTLAESIPSNDAFTQAMASLQEHPPVSFTVLSAEADARSREQRAHGDARNTLRPQLSFAAQYGRVSPINGVTDFYNIHGNYNTFFGGVQIQLPFVDEFRKARARESAADAAHATHQAEVLRSEQRENNLRLQHIIAELTTRAEVAGLDQEIAEDELKTLLLELRQSNPRGQPMTPKEEQTARVLERQRYLDTLNTALDVRKAEISLLRQAGELGTWLQSLTQAARKP